jgi:hypothetical protein
MNFQKSNAYSSLQRQTRLLYSPCRELHICGDANVCSVRGFLSIGDMASLLHLGKIKGSTRDLESAAHKFRVASMTFETLLREVHDVPIYRIVNVIDYINNPNQVAIVQLEIPIESLVHFQITTRRHLCQNT